MPREGQPHPYENSRELQRKLYLAAKRSRNRRFHALYDRIFRPDIMWQAWIEVRKNDGSAGVDGITLEDIEKSGVTKFLNQIQEELKSGTYHPQPVRRVYIEKSDGRQRPLGIPTVKDRVVQQACKIVIEPIFEANFQDCSFGFRPKRSGQEAVLAVKEALVRGWWVVDADIEGYFDNIDHDMLMSLLKRRISDRRVLKLLRQWLTAGIMENGIKRIPEKGTPQGGVISPLLANIYLHVLDMYWTQQFSYLGQIVRYCDDFVIVCRKHHEAVETIEIVKMIMGKLKLTLHPKKTRIVHMEGEDGFDFLGFHFRKRKSKKSGKLVPYIWPSEKAMKRVRKELKGYVERRNLRKSLALIVNELNPVIRGWRNYFKIGNSTKKFQDLDRYLRKRLRKFFLTRKRSTERSFDEWLSHSKLEYFYLSGICAK